MSAVCQHKVDGVDCGKPATAIVEVKRGAAFKWDGLLGCEGPLGRGTGSQYLPICEMHIGNYPDYDGQHI